MDERIVIGLVGGEGVGKTTMANRLVETRNFHKINVMDQVEKFAQHLFSESELQKAKSEILINLRFRGCNINKCYWINLCLTSMAQNHNKIVLDDIWESEIMSNIRIYQIYRPKISKKLIPNIEPIYNDGNIKSFFDKIDNLN